MAAQAAPSETTQGGTNTRVCAMKGHKNCRNHLLDRIIDAAETFIAAHPEVRMTDERAFLRERI